MNPTLVGVVCAALIALAGTVYTVTGQRRMSRDQANAGLAGDVLDSWKELLLARKTELDELRTEVRRLAALESDCRTELAEVRVRLARIEERPSLTTQQVTAMTEPLMDYVETLKARLEDRHD